MRRTVERRLELLKSEGLGFSPGEIVNTLSTKYNVSERTIKYDFARRGQWQPQLLGLGDTRKIVLKAANCFEEIYRTAAFDKLKATTDTAKARFSAIMIQARREWLDTLVPNQSKLDVNVVLPRDFVIRKWSREDADKPEK